MRRRLGFWLVDRFTDYRSRYKYPAPHAVAAEVWWRLEHTWLDRLVGAYRRRKEWERRGFAAGHRPTCHGLPCECPVVDR